MSAPEKVVDAKSKAVAPNGASVAPVAAAETPRATGAAAGTTPKASLFDLDALRLTNTADTAVAKKHLLTVPVRKPNRQEFVRVHPDDAWRLQTATLVTAEDRKTFLVAPQLWPLLPGDLVPTLLVTAINRQGVVFLWPLKLPSADGRASDWHVSALEAANLASSKWVKVVANMSLGGYDVFEAQGELGEPEWPDVTFQKLIELAFKDGFIRDENHPVLRRLRGEL